MHVAAGDESGIERRVVKEAGLLDICVRYGEHTGLTVTRNLHTGDALDDFLGPEDVIRLWPPVVDTMTSHLVSLLPDAFYHFRCLLRKVACAEEGGLDTVLMQYIEDAGRTFNRHPHALSEREVHAVFTGYIELFRIKTQ